MEDVQKGNARFGTRATRYKAHVLGRAFVRWRQRVLDLSFWPNRLHLVQTSAEF